MKISDTISVNPSKTTLGHVETPASSIFRNPVLDNQLSGHSIDIVKLLFPTAGAGSSEFRKYEVPLRTLFATILIVTGLTMLTVPFSTYGVAYAVCSLCFGAFLALGLLTRPVMLGAAVYYCIAGALSLRAGLADISVFALMFGCVIFGITGAGKYSLDTLLRKSINHHKKSVERERTENRLSYKAFHKAKF